MFKDPVIPSGGPVVNTIDELQRYSEEEPYHSSVSDK
jgi:hypothetical protein